MGVTKSAAWYLPTLEEGPETDIKQLAKHSLANLEKGTGEYEQGNDFFSKSPFIGSDNISTFLA